MIEFKGISINYQKCILSNINLSLYNGSFILITGPSGVGKTSLINILTGKTRYKGKVYFYGKRLNKLNIKKINALDMGVVYQESHLFLDKTVYENIEYPLKVINLLEEFERKEKVLFILKLLKIDKYKDTLCSSLSVGEKMLVQIARALVKNPKVVILDEPTAPLDSKNMIMVLTLLKTLSKNKIIIIVSHDKKVTRYVDRTITINNKTIKSDLKTNNKVKPLRINLDVLDNSLNDIKYTKIYSFKYLNVNGLKHIIKYIKDKRLITICLFFIVMVIIFLTSILNYKLNIRYYNPYNKNYLKVFNDNNIDYINKFKPIYIVNKNYIKEVNLINNDIYKLNKINISFKASLVRSNDVGEGTIKIGKTLAKEILKNKLNEMINIYSSKDLLNKYILIDNLYLKVVSANEKGTSLYLNESNFNSLFSLKNISVLEDNISNITLLYGRLPLDNEYISNDQTYIDGLTKVGTFKESIKPLVNKNTYNKIYYGKKVLYVYTKDKNKLIKGLNKKGITYYDDYTTMQNKLNKKYKKGIKVILKYVSIFLFISILFIILIVKYIVYEHTNDIRVYRLLNVKPIDIYNIIITKIFMYTLFICLVSSIICYKVFYDLKKIEPINKYFSLNIKIFLLSSISIIISSLLIGIIYVKWLIKRIEKN